MCTSCDQGRCSVLVARCVTSSSPVLFPFFLFLSSLFLNVCLLLFPFPFYIIIFFSVFSFLLHSILI